MRMDIDDEVYAVDSVFLGPPRLTFPWRARYQAYAIGGVLTVLMLIALSVTGLIGFWPIVYGLITVIGLTRKAGEHITHDFRLRAFGTTVINEVRAPRPARDEPLTHRVSLRGLRRRTYH
ncbi:hypothetical protein [Streptomyces sp. NPDC087294]|uniref:hypothetical protein n=1 Tax=Streptomyces sp. NPDC087294 TaxID=3365777 RepID=UPI0038092485